MPIGKEQPAGRQLDFLKPAEVDQTLLELAEKAGYGDDIASYLASLGPQLKHPPKPETSRRRLDAKAARPIGDKKQIDPTFNLYKMMKDDADNKA